MRGVDASCEQCGEELFSATASLPAVPIPQSHVSDRKQREDRKQPPGSESRPQRGQQVPGKSPLPCFGFAESEAWKTLLLYFL